MVTTLIFLVISIIANSQSNYSCVPSKRAGLKRAGWKMGQNQINVQGQINVQDGKMLNLDSLVG